MIAEIRFCLGVSSDPMFLWVSLNSRPLNLLLVQSHQAEIIMVKRLIQARNIVSRLRVEPKSFDHGCRKNDAFTLSPMMHFLQFSEFLRAIKCYVAEKLLESYNFTADIITIFSYFPVFFIRCYGIILIIMSQ